MNLFLEDFLDPFSFEIESSLIAKEPKNKRDSSKLLIAETPDNIRDVSFFQLDELLQAGDLLVLNETKVENRRIFLKKENSERIFEALFLEVDPKDPLFWKVLLSKSKKIKDGEPLFLKQDPLFQFIKIRQENSFTWLRSSCIISSLIFKKIGEIPIPPYFNRRSSKEDETFYQTVFASNLGSVAAPTASLHFTKDLLQKIKHKGVDLEYLTLHVGYGTFAPLQEENIKTSTLHEECFEISELLYNKLKNKKYKRLIVVGTTTLRVIEYLYTRSISKLTFCDGIFKGSLDVFYYPPYQIKSADYLITNFHLPRSSLLLFIMCLQFKEAVLSYYDYAKKNNFKFYSYGDAMFLQNCFK